MTAIMDAVIYWSNLLTLAFIFLASPIRNSLAQGLIPKCLLFIGPHKTGTTTLQAFFDQNQGLLEEAGYHWVNTGDVKPAAGGYSLHYPLAVTYQWPFGYFDAHVKALKADIARCRQEKRNIILSAEDFSTVNDEQIGALQQTLEGFEVTVVFVYRAWVTKVLSHYNQYAKEQNIQEVSFRDWLFQVMAGTKWHVPDRVNDFSGMLRTYTAAFGVDRLVVLDYYGMLAQRERADLAVMCGIATPINRKVCDEVRSRVQEGRYNPSQPILWNQFAALLSEFAFHYRRVTLSGDGRRLALFNKRGVLRQLVKQKLPLVQSDVLYLKQYSLWVDDYLRATYAANFRYGNRTANERAVGAAQLVELNTDLIRTSRAWRAVLVNMVDATLNATVENEQRRVLPIWK